jgi:hypothetical protein
MMKPTEETPWIPLSERRPEIGDIVELADYEEVRDAPIGWASPLIEFWTHWRPYRKPAPPPKPRPVLPTGWRYRGDVITDGCINITPDGDCLYLDRVTVSKTDLYEILKGLVEG